MNNLDQAVQAQINNIQKKTGKTLAELAAIAKKSGLTKHSEIREMFQKKLGLGYGDANSLVHAVFESDGTRAAEGKSEEAVLEEIYSGAKAGFRPIHEKLIKEINKFGDYEVVPKKGYVSLRRGKQFAMIGPKTNTRFEVGINAKNFKKNSRLVEQPPGSMCNYVVIVSQVGEVDSELVAWLKSAFVGAG
jgi:Domain of unknown function (DUF5655)/Domain of unknown function (DUF4287)